MEKGLVLLVLALVACGSAVAQDEWDEVMATSVMASSVMPTVMPTVSPTTTPLPPKELKPQTFTLKDGNKFCLRMNVSLAVSLTYNSNHTQKYFVTPGASMDTDVSYCNASATIALLRVVFETNQDDSFFIDFEFTGSNKKGDQHWSMGAITLTVQKDFLETGIPAKDTSFNTTDKLYKDDANSNIEYERSYMCSSVQTVTFNKADSIEPKMNVSHLQAQAFSFSDKNEDGFDPARTCQLDSTGANKIVPIAVGAALAGLVVVVLIAYLIGRLRSRRQSSYEALS